MNTLRSIFCDSLRPVKLLTVVLYLLAAIGFCKADTTSPDLFLIFHVAPWWVWALLSCYVLVARVVGLFVWVGTGYSRRFTPILGITLWSLLFSASVVAPHFSMGMLYLVAAVIEMWILARAFAEKTLGL